MGKSQEIEDIDDADEEQAAASVPAQPPPAAQPPPPTGRNSEKLRVLVCLVEGPSVFAVESDYGLTDVERDSALTWNGIRWCMATWNGI
jgi:hypothetical protein